MNNRRNFIKTVVATAGLTTVGSRVSAKNKFVQPDGFTVLFQGDSITDGNRTRNTDWNHVMGHGYAYTIASKLWYEHPEKQFHFLNRGISGNRITHLAERWQTDTLDLKPSVLSILVGINDTEAFIKGNTECTPEQFESVYRNLLKLTREKLPETRFVLGEPFILPVGRVKERFDLYRNEVGKRQEIVKKLAAEFDAIHVPFQSEFDDALSKAPAEYWIWDGIHPMPAGHELMARLWLEKAGALLGVS